MEIEKEKVFRVRLSKKEVKDSGFAFVLLLLLAAMFSKNILFLWIALPSLLLCYIFPVIFYPFSVIWLSFSRLMGKIVSKIILTIIYCLMVVPFGILMRIFGKDSLNLERFKKGKESVLKIREHKYTAADLEKPY